LEAVQYNSELLVYTASVYETDRYIFYREIAFILNHKNPI